MPAPIPSLTFAGGTLILKDMLSWTVRRRFGPRLWRWDTRVSGWRCDALEYQAVRDVLASDGRPWHDNVPAWGPVAWPKPQLPELRPEQKDAVAAWKASGRGVIVMPTGTGKTEVALAIMHEAAVATLIVAPVRDLMYQWHRRILAGLGYDAGVIGDGRFTTLPVSVTTYDSACIHMERLGARFGLVIFDECHHLPGEMRRDAARMSAAPWRLGLTATPASDSGGGRAGQRSPDCRAAAGRHSL
jgi:superfamily II DNA or RNA helicase